MRLPVLVIVALVAVVAGGCGGGGEAAAPPTAGAPAPSGTTGDAGRGGCARVGFPEPRQAESRQAPTAPLDEGTTYALTFATSCGVFTVTLDQESAPRTSASLVALARDGYFDGTVFHRIVPGFVIQGGDPTQTGGGGPGYETIDAPPPDTTYAKGVVAMAKAANEAAGTSGSQFFVVTADDAGLPPEYAVVGRVTDGLDVVETIGAHGDEFEQPTQPIVIESVSVSEQR